ncbi:NIL domain-containing protein [Scytonema sp. PCC 10023]|uniref:NIL domain-containing protein n=1 Tax=Scytonema sp. PCC 10023 TaxID=1680591 RepID=UPI0039C5B327
MALSTIFHTTLGHIYITVPQHYNRQPIVSRLISRYDLTINIAAAVLEAHTEDDGWFNLEIQGISQQVEAGLAYLQELNIEILQLDLKSLPEKNRDKLQLLCASVNSSDEIEDDEKKAALTMVEGQTTRAKFQVCISKNYSSYPVIAGLVYCYGLTVNITGAMLDNNTENDGWFDLELWGRREQIVLGLRYLKQLGLQIWL